MNAPDDILDFTFDPAIKKVTGKLVAGGSHINNALNSTFTGEIENVGGWAKLTMPILRPVDRKPVYAYTVVVTPTDAGLYLTGAAYNIISQGPGHAGGRWDAMQVKP